MNPEDVWVVFNNQSGKILHVYSEEFLADNKAAWYWNDPSAPFTGSIQNVYKIEVITLDKATRVIANDAFLAGKRETFVT